VTSTEGETQTASRPTVVVYTDGACSGNPGPGGFGAVLLFGERRLELSEGYRSTTNNRMELLAVITALEALKRPCVVRLHSDSQYVVNAILKGWLEGWIKRGWRKSNKKPVENVDLWKRLLPLLDRHDVTFSWVKGHANVPENERADQLAVDASYAPDLKEDTGYTSR
jgi:ribonuclease HI